MGGVPGQEERPHVHGLGYVATQLQDRPLDNRTADDNLAICCQALLECGPDGIVVQFVERCARVDL